MSGNATLAVAMIAFVGSHFLLSHPLRRPLVARVGEGPFLGLYSLVAAATLGWAIWARLHVEDDRLLWVAPPIAWDIATVVMLVAAVLLVGSLVRNPALPNPTGHGLTLRTPTGVFGITRHPMMMAFALWAIVHIVLWGSVANLILCAGILVLALFGAAAQDAKKRRVVGPLWDEWIGRTAFWPIAAQISGRLRWRAAVPGWGVLLGGAALWLLATWAHVPAGGPVAGPWRWIG
jgi:uncharacterized membrane protein